MNQFIRISYILAIFFGFSTIAAQAQAPVANFSGTPLNSCSPIVVQFTDLSTNSPTSWSWNLGNGTTSTQQNPSTTYSTPGSYTVVMTATNASGSSTKTQTNYITILPAPSVVFTATDSSAGCGSKVVQFNNASTFNAPGSGSYYWDFGDGTYSTATAPSHTYSTPGAYSVSLVVSNSAGCTKLLTKTNYINVLNKPAAGFSATNNNSCTAPVTTSFTNNSTGATSYYWLFGDGDTSTLANPSHTYLSTGSYTVTLIAKGTGGCNDTMVKPALVNIGLLSASFTQSATSTCTGNGVSFTNTTTPGAGNSIWYFGDGTTSTTANPTHAYTTAGTYTVKLKVTYNNCSDSVTHTVTVATGPSTSFSGSPLASCSAPLTTTFTNNTTGAVSYLWFFGDGTTSTSPNPAHTYNTNGTYTVKLVSTSSNGCTDTLTKTAYVVVQPVSAAISGNSVIGCAPAGASFTATATAPVAITGYSWSFGDGGTGTGISVSHTYAIAGTYTLTLTVTAGTCSTTTTSLVVVGTKPTANFSATPTTTCVNSPVTFTNGSSGATNYIWYFGDGSTSSAANPSYSYSVPGTYTVTLVASNNGCNDTLVKTNYITVQPPSADFTYTYSCTSRKQFTFTNTSIGATSYSWDFGDGSALSTATNPTHTYASFGYYNVTLTATSSVTGCTSVMTKYIQVFDLTPAFTESDTVICKGSTLVLTSVGANYPSYFWDFGDGYQTAGYYAGHTYTTAGIYNLKLVVTDGIGCKDSLLKTARIRVSSPSAAFSNTPNAGCGALAVSFTDLSTPPAGGSITNRQWVFGDGTTLNTTATSVSHNYMLGGNYTVKLIITDGSGCKDSITKANLILVTRPAAQFVTPNTLSCINKMVSFINTSSGTSALTYNWSFGDGGTSTGVSPGHSYTAAGTYNVTLIVTDANGCKDTITKNSYINVSPITSAFTVNDSVAYCPPFTVNFTNASTNAVSYVWIFGNGSISFLNSPSATYTAPGTYTAKLIAINANGCTDTSQKTIVVNTGPSGTLTYTPIAGCLPVTVSFTATALNTTSITYDFDNGITQTTSSTSVTYTYTQPGVYHPKLILSNAGGCSTYVGGIDSIAVNKIRVGFTVNPNPACANTAVQFTDTSNAVTSVIATRNWSFGDGGTSTATNPTHTYTTGGTYTVRLIAATAGGCIDTAYKTVTINPAPLIVGTSPVICAGQSTNLSVTGAATYNWSPATGLSCTNCSNPTATPPSTTTYTITGTSALGCIGTGTLTVTVNPLPSLTVSGPQSICGGGSVTLSASGASSYAWSPSTGLSATTGGTVTASPSATTTYTVSGTNSSTLCSSTASVIVTVTSNPVVTVTATPGTTICAGSSTVIAASGATTYSWSPATGLSSATASNPIATPSATTTYTVTGTANGCSTAVPVTITVTPLPVITISGPSAICNGSSATLSASGATTYSWSPATGLSATTGSSVTANPTATTTYTVTGTTSGCNGLASKTLTVNPLPAVNAGPDAAICAGSATTLTATGATSYSWSPATGLSSTNSATVTANPTATTSYVVTGTDANSCSKSDTVVVTVNTLPVVSAGPAQFMCPGGSVTLNATGASTYVWSPSTGLSATTGASVTASPSATTTYKIVGTSAAGCKDSSTVTVNVNNTPVITVSGTNALCIGSSTVLTAGGATTYTWSPATGLSATTGTSVTANPTSTTTYTVTGTSGVGCSGTATFTVTVNGLPTIAAASPAPICAGASAVLTASGAGTYSWSPSTGLSATTGSSVTATPSLTTVYTITGTDANGCQNTAKDTVTVNARPTVTLSPNVAICPGNSTTLTASGANTYVWSPSTGLSATTGASVTASPTVTTTYKVVGTNAAGCKDSTTVTVTVNGTPSVSVAGTTTICRGNTTTLTASGASTYTWSPATGLSATTGASVTASPTATTTYTVTGTSGIGCTASTTVTVTVNSLPNVNAGLDTGFCAGSSVTLNATGAATYAWSPATGLSSTSGATVTASPSGTTNYVVTGTDANGCSKTDTVLVTVKTPPTVSAGPNVSICPGGSTTLTATGAATYVWTPSTGLSATTGASVTASPSSNTTYLVTGTAANGCTMNASVTVTVNANPAVTISGNNAICAGANTVLTASGASTYTWSPATGLSATTGSSVTASPTGTTTYTVTGSSGVGCSATATFTLTVNPLPTVSGGANKSICAGASTTLTASGATTYTWSPSTGLSATTGTTVTANPSVTTIYTVTGASSAGCVGTANVTVTVNPLPIVSAGPNVSICPGGNTSLTASGASTYVWSPSTGLSATTGATVTATPAGTTTYTVTGTSALGCTNTATVTVSVNATPTVSITGTNAICAGGSTTLNASGATSYTWSPATGLSAATGSSVTASPTTTTTYTVTGTSGVGCTGTGTFTLTVNPLPVVNAGVDTAVCAGSSVTLNATGAWSYSWSPATGLSSTVGSSVAASPTVTTSYVVTGTSVVGCSASDTVMVSVKALPTISAGANAGICPGGSVTLTPSGGVSYVWGTSSSLSCTTCTSPVASPTATTTYTVTGTGANGCQGTASVTVTVNPLPVVTVSGNTNVCAGNSTTLTASGASTYSWSPASGLSCTSCASPTVTPTATTTYKVIGTSGLGCSDSTTITVNLRPLPVVSVNTSQSTCLNSPVQLTASGASTYSWTPAPGLSCTTCPNPVATPAATTTYIVTGIDNYGCMGTAQTTITVLPLPNVSAGPDVSICKGTSTTLNATGAASYVWSPATGLSCTTCASPTASPTSTTAYVLTGTGANGCVNSDTMVVSLYAQPPVNAGPDQTICAGATAQLQASGAMSYVWNPGATLSCTGCPNPVASPMTNTTYMVIGTDVHGCVDSDQVAVTVIPHNPVSIGPGGEVCAGASVQLSASGGDSYAWTPPAGLSCTTCSNPTANPATTTTYKVVIRQGSCFTDTLSVDVIIHPLPTVNAGPDQSIILGNIAQINATGTNIQTYSWSPTDGLSCTTCNNPTASPATDVTYVVSVTSDFGCTAQDDIAIHVRCDGSQIWLPNTFTPNADGQNDRFYPHGKGIDHVDRFRIYDRWGELLYDRTNMPVNDKSYGWDGTFKGQFLKPDVYVWVMDGTCTNGEKLQTKGDISLVR